MTPEELWSFLPKGYLFSIAIEVPVLLIGLSKVHPFRRKFLAGIWLTACTYPIVVLVLPLLLETRWVYLVVAETFAPLAECLLFAAAFRDARRRDYVAITLANLASFGLGELAHAYLGI